MASPRTLPKLHSPVVSNLRRIVYSAKSSYLSGSPLKEETSNHTESLDGVVYNCIS